MPRLPLQTLKLIANLADNVLKPLKISFGGFQAQLGLVPAAVKTGDPSRVFQYAPPLLWLRIDELADLPLLHESLTACARGRVGEQI